MISFVGLLIPDNFPMESLVNDAERLVVSTLVDRLTDGWYVMPDVGILGSQGRQMDIVVAHESDGVAVIEVKGHRAQLDQGVWCSNGQPLNPQPLTQAKNNAYELRSRLRAAHLRGPRLGDVSTGPLHGAHLMVATDQTGSGTPRTPTTGPPTTPEQPSPSLVGVDPKGFPCARKNMRKLQRGSPLAMDPLKTHFVDI
jgi:hypothetical protein